MVLGDSSMVLGDSSMVLGELGPEPMLAESIAGLGPGLLECSAV
jgi:hypothetical protein